MVMARNRLKKGPPPAPTIPELRARLSAAEVEAVSRRESDASLDDALAAELADVRLQLRLAERAANGGR